MDNKKIAMIPNEQIHLDLFELDEILDTNYSNALEIYDMVGKFIYGKANKYRQTASADQMAFTRTTEYQGIDIVVTVTGANIERIDGGVKQRVFVLPGAREEVVEDVLRKLATEKSRASAYKDTSGPNNKEAKYLGLHFTHFELYSELRRIGKTYSYGEIREAIEVLQKSTVSFQSSDGSVTFNSAFFPIVAMAEKGNKGNKGAETRSFVCFHPMVTSSILALNFRRYNYLKANAFSGHFTKLVYRRLCLRWIQAKPGQSYNIRLSTLISSMKDPYPKMFQDTALFKDVMDELVEAEVLERYDMVAKRKGRTIVDYLFNLYPTDAFAKQMAANNKVALSTKKKASPGLPPVNESEEGAEGDVIDQ